MTESEISAENELWEKLKVAKASKDAALKAMHVANAAYVDAQAAYERAWRAYDSLLRTPINGTDVR